MTGSAKYRGPRWLVTAGVAAVVLTGCQNTIAGTGHPAAGQAPPATETALVDQFGTEPAELDPEDELLVRLELDSMRLDPEVAARLCAEATDGKVTVAA